MRVSEVCYDKNMFSQERQKQITLELTSKGRVEVLELARRYGVSEHTIRRDLHVLAGRGLLQKTHGGAVSLQTAHLDWATRAITLSDAKQSIGAKAAQLVQCGQTVIVEAGSTTLSFARQLKVRPITIITNSLDVARLFEEEEEVTLIVSGGEWNARARAFRGATAQKTVATYRADWTILGTCALHPHIGATVTNEEDAALKRAAVAAGLRTVVLADHSKRDQVAAHLVLSPAQLDIVVTDQAWPELEAVGAAVLYAPEPIEGA